MSVYKSQIMYLIYYINKSESQTQNKMCRFIKNVRYKKHIYKCIITFYNYIQLSINIFFYLPVLEIIIIDYIEYNIISVLNYDLFINTFIKKHISFLIKET